MDDRQRQRHMAAATNKSQQIFFLYFLKSYLKARRKAAVKLPLLPTTLQDFILVVGPTQILYISNLPRNPF